MKYLVPLLLISITTAHTWAAEDLEPRAQAPKPLNVMSTEVAPIPIERDIFPNKDLLFYGYYGTANLQPQLIAVQKKFPDLLAKAIDRNFQRKNLTLEKLTPTQQKIVQD
ncbi:MAG: hypothetical protein KDD38_00735, partial [Bdellovibrionales bacterium]|nr:hypothetical protein [Bdellovibrionales bacterium]